MKQKNQVHEHTANRNMINGITALISLIFISLILPALGNAGTWQKESIEGLSVMIFKPTNVAKVGTGRALMVHLHGCAQSQSDIATNGNWEEVAEEFGMIVVAPQVPNGGKYFGCWDYYGASHSRDNRDNRPVINMVKRLIDTPTLGIDANQVYVTGLSSGGGEAFVLGCLAPNLFAGMGLNAAPTVGTDTGEISMPQTTPERAATVCKNLAGSNLEFLQTQLTSIIYGDNDGIVKPTHNTTNAKTMSIIYGATHEESLDLTKLKGNNLKGSGTLISDDDGVRISIIQNSGLAHNWPSGKNNGNFISKNSIDYPRYLTTFLFENNRRLSHNARPEIMIDKFEVSSEKKTISITGLTKDKDGTIQSLVVEIRSSSQESSTEEIDVANDGSFGITKELLIEGHFMITITATDNDGGISSFSKDFWIGEIPTPKAPTISDLKFVIEKDCLTVTGSASDQDNDLNRIDIFVDEKKAASFEFNVQTNRNGEWSIKTCSMRPGTHKAFAVAMDKTNLESSKVPFEFNIENYGISATLFDHIKAGRLSWFSFSEYYLKYGLKPFTLYKQPDGSWSDKI